MFKMSAERRNHRLDGAKTQLSRSARVRDSAGATSAAKEAVAILLSQGIKEICGRSGVALHRTRFSACLRCSVFSFRRVAAPVLSSFPPTSASSMASGGDVFGRSVPMVERECSSQ